MIRTGIDLEAIDRELEQLGRPRADLQELVARYTTPRVPPASARPASDPPASTPPSPVRSDATARLEAGAVAGADVLDDDEDHDEFELLVDDDEIEHIEDDQLESA